LISLGQDKPLDQFRGFRITSGVWDAEQGFLSLLHAKENSYLFIAPIEATVENMSPTLLSRFAESTRRKSLVNSRNDILFFQKKKETKSLFYEAEALLQSSAKLTQGVCSPEIN
jgi:hypothetical protein